jgi:RNA polymerase sigma factor (sigma-70 family)
MEMKGDETLTDTDRDEALEYAVRHAVETALTDKQREAVVLYFFEGLSQSEIARRLGVSQQVIQKRLYGASRRGVVVGGALARLRVSLAPVICR